MDSTYFGIYLLMFRIGATTFGGGLAMLPIITKEFIQKRNWITEEEFLDIVSIAEVLPGAIAINVCIMMGYKIKGVFGGVVATLGVVTPCIIIITIVTYLYNAISPDSVIWHFIRGIRAGVVGILVSVGIKLFSNGVNDKYTYIMFIAGFIVAMVTDFHVVFIIIGGGLIGFIYSKWVKKYGTD